MSSQIMGSPEQGLQSNPKSHPSRSLWVPQEKCQDSQSGIERVFPKDSEVTPQTGAALRRPAAS